MSTKEVSLTQINLHLKTTDLFKYVWSFSGHQTLKAKSQAQQGKYFPGVSNFRNLSENLLGRQGKAEILERIKLRSAFQV